MNKKSILWIVAVVAVAGLWYAFRPELLFVTEAVNESFPATSQAPQSTQAMNNEPKLVAEGTFHANAHETKGTASIYKLEDGKRVLRFTNFETSNGPDVIIYLVAAPDVNEDDVVKKAGFVTLGPIKGTKGDQNYEIPNEVDLGKYQTVTVWCKRFSVNFGSAPLRIHDGMMSMESSEAKVLLAGTFHSNAHETKGKATIYELTGGKRVLRFTEFETSNGPDVNIYLVAAPDVNDDDIVKKAGFVTLGPIKGTKGDQNYEIPADVDLSKYQSVTVWCKRFSVNFGTAPLKSSGDSMSNASL
jgi:urease accessory protein UreE